MGAGDKRGQPPGLRLVQDGSVDDDLQWPRQREVGERVERDEDRAEAERGEESA